MAGETSGGGCAAPRLLFAHLWSAPLLEERSKVAVDELDITAER